MPKTIFLKSKFFNLLTVVTVATISSSQVTSSYAAAQVSDTLYYLPVDILNNTHIAKDADVYITAKALSANGRDCFIKFDPGTGEGTCTEVNSDTKSLPYSYKLTSLPYSNGEYHLLIPKVTSGRFYISVGSPMDFYVDSKTLKIIDPDGFKPRDSNYYTLYDKFEFSYNDGGVWTNPTAVDFFSLPIHLYQSGSTSGVKDAGISSSRADVFNKVQETINEHDKTTDKIWGKLFLTYSDDSGQSTTLRLAAPGKAMIPGIPGTVAFDQNYLNNFTAHGFNYIDYLWDYYKTHEIVINCGEIKSKFALDDYVFTGKVVNNKWEFTNQTKSYTEYIEKPEHSTPFFAGASGTFDASNNTPKAILVRELTSAFEVGLLPAENGTLLNKNYFISQKNNFYKINSLLPETAKGKGPWYDLYSKALHSFGELQPIYTFAYDDALGQDGTLHDSNHANPSHLKVTIADMTGTAIPDPYTDDATYTVIPVMGKGSVVTYNGQQLESNKSVNNVKIPFEVVVNDNLAKIYIKHPMVKPHFGAADGIVINHEAGTNKATIIFPAP